MVFFCCDAHGNLLYHIDKNAGLSSSSSRIDSFGEFDDGRIWLSMENGFAILGGNAEQKEYSFEGVRAPSIYKIATSPKEIYVTTTSGVFRIGLDQSGRGATSSLTRIDAITYTELIRFENQILMSGTKGILQQVEGRDEWLWQNEAFVASNSLNSVFCVGTVNGKYSVLKFDGKKISQLAQFQLPFHANRIVFDSDATFWIFGFGSRLTAVSFRKDWGKNLKSYTWKMLRLLGTR